MKIPEIIKALRNNMVETGSLICIGCGREHNCSTHGCAIMRETADTLEQLSVENAQLRAVITESDPNFFKRKCRVCGCDWNHPCNDHDFWINDDLCSAHINKRKETKHDTISRR